jgi:hypothetical protein
LLILNPIIADDDGSLKREVEADTKFRDTLQKHLASGTCIVTSHTIFEDPKNYPQLKGSTEIEIKAAAFALSPERSCSGSHSECQ